MAAVLNRTTKEYLPSVNTPEYPVEEWIINPDVSAVAGYPSKFWIIGDDTDETITLMSQAEMDAVDAAELEASRDATSERMEDIEDIVRAVALAHLDLSNIHASTVTAILDAIDAATTLADLKTRVGAIADLPQRTGAQLKNVVRSKLGT